MRRKEAKERMGDKVAAPEPLEIVKLVLRAAFGVAL